MKLVLRVLGPANVGRLEYWLQPKLKHGLGGAFNGQERRHEIFRELLAALPFEAIVETGTNRGTTAFFFAEKSSLPIYTVEANPRYYAFAALHLSLKRDRVHLRCSDSREFLRELAADPRMSKTNVFFYLDAHWEDDLPLREELTLIFEHWKNAVVMVDDFQVPGTDYGFDDYGPAGVLALEYLEPLSHLRLEVFFPSAPPELETGSKRGCVVLCREKGVIQTLDTLVTLIHR